MTREARQFRCPENVLGWIPWYADGGLNAQQKGQVEAHAAECSDCRAELDIVAGAPFEIDMALPDPDRLFDEITARIEAGEREIPPATAVFSPAAPPSPGERNSRLADDELDRIGRWVFDPSTDTIGQAEAGVEIGAEHAFGKDAVVMPEPWRVTKGRWSTERIGIFAAAAALAIFLLGGLGGALFSSLGASSESIVPVVLAGDSSATLDGHGFEPSPGQDARLPGDENAIYRSATVPSETASADAEAAMLDVVFADSVSLREVSEALREVGVEIVSGPTSLGVYRVRLTRGIEDGRPATAADVAAVANRLKAPDSAVAIFAEAVP